MTEVRRVITLGAMAAAMVAFGPAAPGIIADTPALAASTPNQPGAGDFGSFLAGMHAKEMRDFGSMADYLSRVLAHDPDNVDLLQQGFIAMASGGRLSEAAEIGRKLESQAAGSDTVSLVLAIQDLRVDKRTAALTRLGALSSDGLNKFTVPLVKGWVALEDGKLDEALAALAPLAEVKGVQTLYDLHAGLLNELGGHPAEADAAYKKTLEDPEKLSFRVVEIIGNFYQRQKRPADAKAVYDTFRTAYPDNPLLPLLTEKQADANVAPIIGSARDGLAEALFNLASVLFQEDARDMALVYTRLALDLRKDYPAAQVLLGDLLAGEKLYADAVAVYKGVDTKSPFGWQARLALADALNRIERAPEAVTLLQAMSDERKDSADAPMMLGDILRSSERFDEAAKAYDEAIARIGPLKKEHWSLLYYRGIAYERSKQWDRAEADFTKALEFEPDQPYVLNYLAYTWVDKGMNYDRALTMLNKAVEEKPEDGYIVDSLGWVYFRLGKYDQAVEQLERAVELVPGDSVINDHLGDAYWRVGRHNEARFQWHRALNLNPEKDQVVPIESKLDKGLPRRDILGLVTPAALRLAAPAKLNLYLHVVGRRPDGYHLLDSLVAFAAVGDELTFSPASALSLTLDGPFGHSLGADDDNLVHKAARALAAQAGRAPGAVIRLTKRLPVASGIGGGSADAAATLQGLNRLWNLGLPDTTLAQIGLTLGADVPVCLAGIPSFFGGIGDEIASAGPLPHAHIVLVNPGAPLATAAVFRARAQVAGAAHHSRPARWTEAVPDAPALAGLLAKRTNDLTAAAIGLLPAIADVLAALEQQPSCLLARLSGSGATCFGLFAERGEAREAAAAIAAAHPDWWVVATMLAAVAPEIVVVPAG